MSTAVLTNRIELSPIADSALKAATRFWFGVAVIGQLMFAFAIATFYGMAAVRGDHHAWDKHFTHGYIPGDTMGNFAIAMHLVSAVVIMLAGAVQLIPQIRSRFPAFHRWNGRIYMLAGVGVSTAGLYMTWIRGSVGDVAQHLGSTLNAVLIWIFAALALRYAMARDFRTHSPLGAAPVSDDQRIMVHTNHAFSVIPRFQRAIRFRPGDVHRPVPHFSVFRAISGSPRRA